MLQLQVFSSLLFFCSRRFVCLVHLSDKQQLIHTSHTVCLVNQTAHWLVKTHVLAPSGIIQGYLMSGLGRDIS